MIQQQTLKYLVKNKIKDAEALIKNSRFPASIYLAGYAVEVALKYKICKTLQFAGFPESQSELSAYLQQINNPANTQPLRINIRDIRNHDLPKLLFYSGVEYRIKNQFYREWSIISTWNPENRYKKIRVIKTKGEAYVSAAKKIIKEIM